MKILILFTLLSVNGFACDYLSQKGCLEGQRCIYQSDPREPICFNIVDRPQPLISFPFSSQRVVTCDQGPHMPNEKTHSHAWSNSMDALDLRTKDSEAAGKIYAGLSGKVVIYNKCREKNTKCGAGFGNQVKILNSSGYLLFYAHLSKVYVRNNQEVKAGDLIGVEGNTGWTGRNNRHLHMSVHFDWRSEGEKHWTQLGWLPTSTPFQFRAQEIKTGSVFVMSTQTIKCIRRKYGRFLDAAVSGRSRYHSVLNILQPR